MGKRFALGAVIIVLLSAASVATAALLELKSGIDPFRPGTIKSDAFEGVEPGKPETILLLGSDRRFGDKKKGIPPRSDSMMLVRLDPKRHATAVMSVPRDLRATIPGHGVARINTAYGLGGPVLSAKTVEQTLGVDVRDIINVGFGGFQRAINYLGCAYIDVDRRYFNDNHPPVESTENYAAIDIKPGYQRLCGGDALSYVRFRHLDDDYVRAARQQDFVRQFKSQVGVGTLFDDRDELLKIFGRYTQTSITRSTTRALSFLKLVVDIAGNPVTEVPFPTGDVQKDQSIEISPARLHAAGNAFEEIRGRKKANPKKARKAKRVKKRKGGLSAGMTAAKKEGEDVVLNVALHVPKLQVYFPAARLARGGYAQGGARYYRIKDRGGGLHDAYRIVLWQGEAGQYYGVQGVRWGEPPIVKDYTDKVRMRKRTYLRFFDAKHIRRIAWHGPTGWYWVSNTLTNKLANDQMMDIARSLQRIGQ